MAGGGGFREVFDRIEAAALGGDRADRLGRGLDPERADVRAVLRGWVGFVEGAILASLEREDADREALIDATVAVLNSGIRILRTGTRSG